MKYLDVALRVLCYAKIIFQNYSKTNQKKNTHKVSGQLGSTCSVRVMDRLAWPHMLSMKSNTKSVSPKNGNVSSLLSPSSDNITKMFALGGAFSHHGAT
jgi:hypothetical protein